MSTTKVAEQPLSLAPSYASTNSQDSPPSPTLSSSASTLPPAYSTIISSSSSFHPTLQLQIETQGKRLLSLPLPPRAESIPIFPIGSPSEAAIPPAYLSIRPQRCSGSCYLTTSASVGADDEAIGSRLSETTYRFGPGRPARVTLWEQALAPLAAGDDDEAANNAWDVFTLEPRGVFTRRVGFASRLGEFEWRYGSRAERKGLLASMGGSGGSLPSLLVLEQILATTKGEKEQEPRRVVAWFVRSAEWRTAGSSASSAGNGGRLLLDLRPWEAQEHKEREAGVERKMVEVLAVTTCLSMLKKEVDRRRAQQCATMAAVLSS